MRTSNATLLAVFLVGCAIESGGREAQCLHDPAGLLSLQLAESVLDEACAAGVDAGVALAVEDSETCSGPRDTVWIFSDPPPELGARLCDGSSGVPRGLCEATVTDVYRQCLEASGVRGSSFLFWRVCE